MTARDLPSTQAPPVLYFDLGSPYAYLALERARATLGLQPELEPVLLGALFAQRGFGSWAATGAREQRIAEIELRARRYGLPAIVWPPAWPADGLAAMRCATWAKWEGAAERFAHAVFAREFAAGANISDAALLAACAKESGLDPERMLREIDTPTVKQLLRHATEQAWQAGVRGIPSLRVGACVFYGDDQLELAAGALSGAPPARAGAGGAAPAA